MRNYAIEDVARALNAVKEGKDYRAKCRHNTTGHGLTIFQGINGV